MWPFPTPLTFLIGLGFDQHGNCLFQYAIENHKDPTPTRHVVTILGSAVTIIGGTYMIAKEKGESSLQ